MNLARVVSLTDNVEVILKKVIDDGKHSINVSYVAEIDNQLFNITLTVNYKTKETRDREFKEFDKEVLVKTGKELEPFKHEL